MSEVVSRRKNSLGMSVLGLIPARGGSKRLPRKNAMLLRGKPLVLWTIEAARQSELITQLMCSTDDEAIAEICHKNGCAVLLRPAELATDEATSVDVVKHAMRAIPGFDVCCLLQPTSPLRTSQDIDDCIALCSPGGNPVMTVHMGANGYEPNGAVYCYPRDHAAVWQYVKMPESRSVDIDTEDDFKKAERIIRG